MGMSVMEKANAIVAIIEESPSTGGASVAPDHQSGFIRVTVTDQETYERLIDEYGDDPDVEIKLSDPEQFARNIVAI